MMFDEVKYAAETFLAKAENELQTTMPIDSITEYAMEEATTKSQAVSKEEREVRAAQEVAASGDSNRYINTKQAKKLLAQKAEADKQKALATKPKEPSPKTRPVVSEQTAAERNAAANKKYDPKDTGIWQSNRRTVATFWAKAKENAKSEVVDEIAAEAIRMYQEFKEQKGNAITVDSVKEAYHVKQLEARS